jgi:hypothetical protein
MLIVDICCLKIFWLLKIYKMCFVCFIMGLENIDWGDAFIAVGATVVVGSLYVGIVSYGLTNNF